MKYSLYVISNKPHLFPTIQESLQPEQVTLFDGSRCQSFAKLVNSCVEQAPTEIVIMMSDKVLPTAEHVKKILELIKQGYGIVGLYRFAFFGFKKELFRRIGPLDERFVGGGYEDDDFYIRLKEANISMYLSEEVQYNKSQSSWNYALSKPHFINKWLPNFDSTIKLHHNKIKRLLPEELHSYNFGEREVTKFLEWEKSVVLTSKAKKFIKAPKNKGI
jgi:predicted glycosyltransferase involved in capsule biosynthesis